IGGADFDVAEGGAVGGAHNVYAPGKFTSPADAPNKPLPVDFDPRPRGFNPPSPAARGPHPFVLKLDSGGNFNWVRTTNILNDPGEPGRGAIAVQANGTVFFTGSFLNDDGGFWLPDSDALVAQLDTNGRFLGLRVGGGKGQWEIG